MTLHRLTPWLVPLALIAAWQIGRVLRVRLDALRPGAQRRAGRRLAPRPLRRAVDATSRSASPGLPQAFSSAAASASRSGSPTACPRLSERLTDTTLQMIRNVPHLALIPLVILWFGIDEAAKLFLVALGVFFPIYVNTCMASAPSIRS